MSETENKDQATQNVDVQEELKAPAETVSVEVVETAPATEKNYDLEEDAEDPGAKYDLEEDAEDEDPFLLSDGTRFKVNKGKGKDMMAAQRKAGSRSDLIMVYNMQQLVLFQKPGTEEWKKRTIEYFQDLDQPDYNKILVAHSEINF